MSLDDLWSLAERMDRRREERGSGTRARPTDDAFAGADEMPDDAIGARPTIFPSVDLVTTVNESIDALRDDPEVFVRASAITRVIESDGTDPGPARELGAPVMRRAPPQWITERLSVDGIFLKKKTDRKTGEEKLTQITPPPWIAVNIIARGTWPGFRALKAVATSPAMRLDGSVLQSPGYDEASGLVYLPRASYRAIPDEPTVREALDARERLLDVIVDFPMKQLGRAGWLSLLFTLVARDIVNGAVPCFVIDAPTAGSGKTLLVRAAHLIAYGVDVAVMSMPPDDEEFRKQITTTLLAGDPAVLLDNVTQPIGGDSLEAVITASKWRVRLLGKNEDSGTLDVRIVWIATGNGVQLVGDMGRRTERIRLESNHEKPEERTDYSHADRAGEERFLSWVRANRAGLVVDALTCLRAWHVHGRGGETKEWGSFSAWASTIARCIQWLGLPDPTLARATEDSTLDPTRAALAIIYNAIDRLADKRGVTAGELVKAAFPARNDLPNGEDDLAEAISFLTPNAKGDAHTRARVLGRKLKAGQIIQGRKLITIPGTARAVRYAVTTDLTADSGVEVRS